MKRTPAVPRAFLAVASFAAACSEPPARLDQPFDWEVSRHEMRNALLATCGASGTLYATGGHDGSGVLLRYIGRRWVSEALFPRAPLHACWVGTEDAALAVGEKGEIYRRNAEGWRDESVDPAVTLYDVAAFGEGGRAIAVGSDEGAPIALHYDAENEEWARAPLPSGAPGALRALWAASSSQVWAVGDGGSALFFDGQAWRSEDSTSTEPLHALHGIGDQELYAVGGTDEGLILVRTPAGWTTFAETEMTLRAVWTAPRHPLYAAGAASYLVRFDRRRGVLQATHAEIRTPARELCLTDLLGVDDAVFATAANCETERGAMLSHGSSFAGPLFIGQQQ